MLFVRHEDAVGVIGLIMLFVRYEDAVGVIGLIMLFVRPTRGHSGRHKGYPYLS